MPLNRPTGKHDSWYVRFKDRTGTWRRLRAYPDQRNSKLLNEKIESLMGHLTSGVPIPESLTQWLEERLDLERRKKLVLWGILPKEYLLAQQPVSEHVAAYKAYLQSRGRSAKHLHDTSTYLTKLFAAAQIRTYPDITAEKITTELGRMKSAGTSQSSCNHYIRAVKAFCRWMCGPARRATVNPVHWLSCEDEQRDRKHVRRVPTSEEVRKLIEATRSGPERGNMTGEERSLLYWLAVTTGLRAGEIRSLAKSAFDLDAEVPTVTCLAAYTKNRKAARQPLDPQLVERLRAHLALKSGSAKAFNMCYPTWLIHVLRADLLAAGLKYRDEAERVWDFHAFRHTFITYLDQAGIDPRAMQELARHGSLKMTLLYCQEKGLERKAAVIAKLPGLTG